MPRAFSSKVDAGSRRENATNKESEPRSDSIGAAKALAEAILAVSGALCATSARAHGAGGVSAAEVWWEDPLIAAVLILTSLAYLGGLIRALRRRPRRWPVAKWRAACFVAAIATIAIALLSPLDTLSQTYFSAHMGQHLLLMLVAAPLLAASDAQLVLLRLFPLARRRRLGFAVSRLPGVKEAGHRPVAAWLAAGAFMVSIAFWHLPAAFDWALRHPWVHALEHLTLIGAAIAFWRVVLTSGQRRLSPGMAVIMVSLVGIQGAFMGGLISIAPHPLYAAYAGNSLNDQALAGVMMCIPASLVYLSSTIWALVRMLHSGQAPKSSRSQRSTASLP